MHCSLLSLLVYTCFLLAASDAAAIPDEPALPQPAAFAKKRNISVHHFSSSQKMANPFAKRQATKEQVVKRQRAPHAPHEGRDGFDSLTGKQRIVYERDAPSPSPHIPYKPCDGEFYLQYMNSGTGADSLYASVVPTDNSDNYLQPVMEMASASLFSLVNGQLLSSNLIADTSSDSDILSFNTSEDIEQAGYTVPSLVNQDDILVAPESAQLKFNLCSSEQASNILHLTPSDSVDSRCFPVAMKMIFK